MLIEKYLEVVVKQRGSDLHISAGLPPVVRIDGNLQRMDVMVNQGTIRRKSRGSQATEFGVRVCFGTFS